jgi:hypothetical protein
LTGPAAAMEGDPVSDGSEIGVIANINENRRLSMIVNLLGFESPVANWLHSGMREFPKNGASSP